MIVAIATTVESDAVSLVDATVFGVMQTKDLSRHASFAPDSVCFCPRSVLYALRHLAAACGLNDRSCQNVNELESPLGGDQCHGCNEWMWHVE